MLGLTLIHVSKGEPLKTKDADLMFTNDQSWYLHSFNQGVRFSPHKGKYLSISVWELTGFSMQIESRVDVCNSVSH